MLAPLAEPIMDQVKGAILPKIRNGYGWYPDPFPTDFSSEENEYKVKNAFAGLPEELKGAYQTILTMQNTLSKEIGAAVPTPAVTEAPAPVQTEPSFPAPLAPRPSKSERVRESADAAYTVAEIQEKWEQVKDTPETMPADYLEALRMHYEISQNKGDKKKIEKMEVHNADREKAALEKTINDCTTSPDMLPPDAKELLAMFHAIEKHGLLLPENAKLTLMERAMNVGDDDLASRIDAYSIPKAQVSAVAQSQPMQVRSSRQKS